VRQYYCLTPGLVGKSAAPLGEEKGEMDDVVGTPCTSGAVRRKEELCVVVSLANVCSRVFHQRRKLLLSIFTYIL